MKTEKITGIQQVEVARALKYIQVKGDLYVFSYTETVKEKKMQLFTEETTKNNTQGFILKKDLDIFIDGGELVTENKYAVVTQSFINRRRTVHGDVYLNFTKDFDAYVRNKGNNDLVIRDDYGNSHMMFDIDDGVLPVAIYCEYISANMNNRNYNLDKAIKILTKNPNVRFTAPKGKPTINKIPYYNAEDNKTHCISFIFSPTKEQVNQMWELQQKLNKKYPSTVKHEAIFELDILGLRKGGAALFDSFGGEYNE